MQAIFMPAAWHSSAPGGQHNVGFPRSTDIAAM
jgi:hypothetical protein